MFFFLKTLLRINILRNYYKKIAVGGTFDKFHRGHEILIKTAFDLADSVLIGVTSDTFAGVKNHKIESSDIRISNIEFFVEDFQKEYVIKLIEDAMGTADVDANLEAIVVSPETEHSAVMINKERSANNLDLLDIVVIEWILADDGTPISSTRIRRGEIDNEGKLL